MGRKVILSRKGFDGTTGGKASPIIDGKLVSLPIPRADSDHFYKKLVFSPTESYLKVMKDLGIKLYSEAHVDPDIRKSTIPQRPENWRGLFGQSGTSQGTLHNRQVGKGDIFLFFGWFKEAKRMNGVYQYIRNAPDIHAIFGYLEVDRVFDIKEGDPVPDWMKYHPHIRDREEYGTQRNAIYMATKSFSKFPQKQGWGCFKYDKRLVLTKKGAKKRTIWELPSCFQEERENFNSGIKIWKVLQNGNVEIQTNGRGDQELYISDNPEVVAWAENLISSCTIYE
ncbi:hypothetical protein [Fervidibacillus halotolerans]|uniref:Nucleotide modification associated domain-containing protein n=1 Tax=Fervidibacillus halotolerans TaxID=2980027 RepID=A0A9E8LZQ0_9BACI|nr:hypothetical protein [Fervidibacillus halotolerans]WAA12788.1 hypothetical protein OE105_01185 [Fervidibacillus halotolerans]